LVKAKIAHYESAGGMFRIHGNADGTVDCGLYQINSRHFVEKGVVGRVFTRVFKRHGIGESLTERVVAAMLDDKLNEELARELYRLRGLKSWTSSRKFIK